MRHAACSNCLVDRPAYCHFLAGCQIAYTYVVLALDRCTCLSSIASRWTYKRMLSRCVSSSCVQYYPRTLRISHSRNFGALLCCPPEAGPPTLCLMDQDMICQRISLPTCDRSWSLYMFSCSHVASTSVLPTNVTDFASVLTKAPARDNGRKSGQARHWRSTTYRGTQIS